MADARFHLLPGVIRISGRAHQGWSRGRPHHPGDRGPARRSAARPEDGPELVAWRLLSGNNHELGRSAEPFDGWVACCRAIAELKSALGGLAVVIAIDAASGQWTWRLESGGSPVAVSARAYRRQRECRYNLDQFLAHVVHAALPADRPEPSGSSGHPDDVADVADVPIACSG